MPPKQRPPSATSSPLQSFRHLSDEPEALARRALTIALRTVTAVTGDVDAARDIAQDVTVIVITRHGDLRDEVSFDAWAIESPFARP